MPQISDLNSEGVLLGLNSLVGDLEGEDSNLPDFNSEEGIEEASRAGEERRGDARRLARRDYEQGVTCEERTGGRGREGWRRCELGVGSSWRRVWEIET